MSPMAYLGKSTLILLLLGACDASLPASSPGNTSSTTVVSLAPKASESEGTASTNVAPTGQAKPVELPQDCSTPPPGWDPPWPEQGVKIRPADITDKRVIHLTRRDGEGIRCALEAHMRTPEARRQVASDYAERVANWRLGAPLLDGSNYPRIGAFYVQRGERNNEVVLSHTLDIRPAFRYGLRARLSRTDRWRVTSFSGMIAHRRR